ncbi:hypothetical protein DFH07DRAFT_965059 [Mycena maculata]|uniref:Uncharacterized protein n=1 Tax=Mycena maculata TaxID=230809 RepID=A0AAD7N0F6_9AGAR|nr:hypothetical protein DFH07DRAFT_965059 [Mycena maculata]
MATPIPRALYVASLYLLARYRHAANSNPNPISPTGRIKAALNAAMQDVIIGCYGARTLLDAAVSPFCQEINGAPGTKTQRRRFI